MSKGEILIVEDSFVVALHLEATLENEGYKVIGKCDSGENAIALLDELNPCLVLMDIMLNGMLDGIEVAGVIRERYDIPVVYITALSDKATIQRAKLTQPYGFLTKPFDDREIFTIIEMAIYKHSIERKFRESEEKYFSTLKSISDAVIVVDNNFDITYLNHSAQALVHYTHTDALDKPIFEVVKLKDIDTGDFPINPLQCEVGGRNVNAIPENLVLVNSNGQEIPIGEGRFSPLLGRRENFIGFVITFRDITEKRDRKLMEKQLEIQKKMAQLEGEEKERSRIAKDLHDGLGQMLNAIKMNAQMNFAGEAASQLFMQLDETIEECVRISENLSPAKLLHFDLATCLQSLCEGVAATSAKVHFKKHGEILSLMQNKKVHLYRIAQEALSNAIKHAKATTITIQLSQTDHYVDLTIEDDGQGLGLSNSNLFDKGNGLNNMKSRAEIMVGNFVMESRPGDGVLINVNVPLDNLDHAKI
ncbi:MAG: response regulator [Cyclobacteriaceae bacterium]|nr:response regulator [Cyclobacteriaceae bacterium]